MDSKKFWQIIDEARGQAGHWEDMMEPLTDSLARFDEEEIFYWQQIFNEYQNLSYKKKLWAAAYIINEGCSDDAFDYFRAWLIAQGRIIFMNALQNPETLANADIFREVTEFEEIMGAGAVAYDKKHGIEPDYTGFYNEIDDYPLFYPKISDSRTMAASWPLPTQD